MTSWICLRHGISSYRSFADNSLIQKDSVVPFDRILLSLFCRYRDIAIDSDNSHEGLFDGYDDATAEVDLERVIDNNAVVVYTQMDVEQMNEQTRYMA